MQHPRATLAFVVALFSATFALGQTLTIGPTYMYGYTGFQNTFDFTNLGTVRTAVDIGNPATATGNVTSVKMYWTQTGCAGAIKVKFFRRTGTTLTMFAERGPFTSSFDNEFTMSPPVPVQQGDLVGVTRLTDCGNIAVQLGTLHRTDGYVEFPGDVTGTIDMSKGQSSTTPLALTAVGTATESLRGVIPMIGSIGYAMGGGDGVAALARRRVAAATGNFRTSMQLLYAGETASGSISGRLVFHPAGTAASPSDHSIPFTLIANQPLTFSDLMSAFGVNGVGSVDVVMPAGSPMPLVRTYAFNDAGTPARNVRSDLIDVSGNGGPEVISFGSPGYLIAPSDPLKLRFQVGVRTLFSGATIEYQLLDTRGAPVGISVRKVYAANYTGLADAQSFFGVPLMPDQVIVVNVVAGSAIVFATTADSISDAPTMQIAEPMP